ncbi:MAG: phosphoglycerate kinase [Parcubacteria group bacterium]|nr:phosphoglycerate kinase [Parcubacteria group bacterium]
MNLLQDLDLSGKTVLLRLNLNVPLADGKIVDDFRIKAVLPTIEYVKARAKKTIIAAHLGRPDGRDPKFSLKPVADYLRQAFGDRVSLLADCIGEDVKQAIDHAPDGSILLLENLRYHKGERAGEEGFGKALAQLADIYINDAFGDSYESYASVIWPPKFIPSALGLRFQKEIETLDRLKNAPQHPFVVLIGGVKITEKMGAIRQLAEKADHILVGGGIANTLLAASGIDVKESLMQEDEIPLAQELMASLGDKLVLPSDVRAASKRSDGSIDKASLRFSQAGDLRAGEAIYDIGPITTEVYKDWCGQAKDVFWAGPMGYIEWDLTAAGSTDLAQHLAKGASYAVIGGGETAELLASIGLTEKMAFVSTGGGAALNYLSGQILPGLAVLK